MSLITWLYLIDVAGGINNISGFVGLLSLVVGTVMYFVFHISDPNNKYDETPRRVGGKTYPWLLLIGIVGTTLTLAIPSEKTLYLMLGAKTTQDIIANPKVQETGGKVLDLINKKLEEFAEDKKK